MLSVQVDVEGVGVNTGIQVQAPEWTGIQVEVAGMHRNTQYASMFMTCVLVLYGCILFLMYPGRTRPKICLSFSKVVAVGWRPPS